MQIPPMPCIYRDMRTRYFYFFLMLAGLFSTGVQGQELSGIWQGNYSKNILMTRPQRLVVELFLHDDSLITGASHLYYKNNQYEHYTLVGKYNNKDSTVFFKEDSTLGVRLGLMVSNCLGNYKTKLLVTDSSLQLNGEWGDNATGLFHCPTVKVFLEKPLSRKNVKAMPAIAKVEDKNLERASEIQSLIEVPLSEKDSIKVELFDNMQIDGDIISLYVNDSTVLYKQLLTATPLVFYVSLNKGEPVCKIKMAAESMGSDPPCTALMLVTTSKGVKHQVNLSSNYGKNSIVELFLKE